MKLAAIYARYSCDNQTEQSIEGQIHVCQEYAKQNDIYIVDEYIDRAMTATNDNRAGFQRMLTDSAQKKWQIVLVYKLDRFARNKFEAVINRKRLSDNGIELVSAMERIPDGPEGKLMAGMLEEFNQYFSLELAQKVKRGMRETRRKGLFQGGNLLYGYKVVDRKIYIDDERVEIVKYIYEQFAVGKYVREIIAELTAEGVLYKGKPFAENTVFRILKNKKYSGVYKHEDEIVDNMYPRIVPETLFQTVRAKVEKNRYGKKSVKVDYLFKHKMICGYCGNPISSETGTARNGETKYYYKCRGRKVQHNGCEQRIIRKELLEEYIINTIVGELSKTINVKFIVSKLLELQDKQIAANSTVSYLEKEKVKTEKALQNLISAIEQGIISKTTNKRLHELEQQQEDYERLLAIEKSKTAVKLSEDEIRSYYEAALKMEARMIVTCIIKQIVLYNDKIKIYLNNPLRTGPDESQDFSFYSENVKMPEVMHIKPQLNEQNMLVEIYIGF